MVYRIKVGYLQSLDVINKKNFSQIFFKSLNLPKFIRNGNH